ncbi:N-terminal acetyltransferase complex ARD1 subunit [Spironucleus salmonicida]|uniref:N-terminal acetyltransferase complex ARD1 subunit n=1 Tax=Spironucleus salmonicida TaxID=348837 RepID=V6LHD1_9EUKA|nr:N-terminal acetyltransferase complex ARD1 subunit [Spironucleus salmonicida]|eukprot:EST43693.1 N-terminal acetyltransferase complex ARD1 subunit [Spironucleus salmonicida]
MFSIRRFNSSDIPQMQQINLQCLPENYSLRYWLQHLVLWPECSYVAVIDNEVIGYIMGKCEDGHGHITSVAVLNDYRCMGVANRLMVHVHRAMKESWKVKHCTLHVRKSNNVAIHLYQDLCGYKEKEIDAGYFADGEDAWKMTCQFE